NAFSKKLSRLATLSDPYRGYETVKLPQSAISTPEIRDLPSRFDRHTQQCGSCRVAYQRSQQVSRGAVAGAIALLAMAFLTEGWVELSAVVGFVLAAAMAAMFDRLKTHFEKSYNRQ
ncbi:MAG: hypothetical protein ACP5D4_12445, partial [Baaleninema sp.]